MKTKNKFRLIPLIVLGLVFTFSISCSKDEIDFNPSITYGSMTDQVGNTYKTVKIGNQVWMAENLKTYKYNDGTTIPRVTNEFKWYDLSTGAYCDFRSNQSDFVTYGILYNGFAVQTGKLAPAGWHVPTDKDWTTLENYVAANLGTSGSVGKALASTSNWDNSTEVGAIGNNLKKNNSTGFTALPGGSCDVNGVFHNKGSYGYWWSSTQNYTCNYSRYLSFDLDILLSDLSNEGKGLSVRLVKDN